MQTGKAENYTQINNAESQRYRTKFFEGSIPSFTSKQVTKNSGKLLLNSNIFLNIKT